MNPRLVTTFAATLVAAVAAWLWYTGLDMPERVASSFDASGRAARATSRHAYLAVQTFVLVVVSAAGGVLPAWLARRGSKRLNIPHRDRWLAPPERARSVEFLALHGACFALAVALFVAWIHALVVQANLREPPMLSNTSFLAAVVSFIAFIAVWVGVLLRRFRRPRS